MLVCDNMKLVCVLFLLQFQMWRTVGGRPAIIS